MKPVITLTSPFSVPVIRCLFLRDLFNDAYPLLSRILTRTFENIHFQQSCVAFAVAGVMVLCLADWASVAVCSSLGEGTTTYTALGEVL
jgi:hypothetical protein